jgi:hypothetical protein
METINLKARERYEQTKEDIFIKRKEILQCVCGVKVTRHHIHRHYLTAYHKAFIEMSNENG